MKQVICDEVENGIIDSQETIDWQEDFKIAIHLFVFAVHGWCRSSGEDCWRCDSPINPDEKCDMGLGTFLSSIPATRIESFDLTILPDYVPFSLLEILYFSGLAYKSEGSSARVLFKNILKLIEEKPPIMLAKYGHEMDPNDLSSIFNLMSCRQSFYDTEVREKIAKAFHEELGWGEPWVVRFFEMVELGIYSSGGEDEEQRCISS